MLCSRAVAALCCTGVLASHAFCTELGENTRPQAIQLQRGWNAVFLEVYPVEAKPSALFAQTPIDVVAGYFAPESSAQFMTDPDANLFSQAGWGVWYAENRPMRFSNPCTAFMGSRLTRFTRRAISRGRSAEP